MVEGVLMETPRSGCTRLLVFPTQSLLALEAWRTNLRDPTPGADRYRDSTGVSTRHGSEVLLSESFDVLLIPIFRSNIVGQQGFHEAGIENIDRGETTEDVGRREERVAVLQTE